MSHRFRSLNRYAVALAMAGMLVAARAGVNTFAAPAASFDTLPNLNFNQGQDVTVAFAAHGFPTGLTYTAEGLPPGLSMTMGVDTLGHEVGILHGTLPADTADGGGSEGVYNVRVRASDGAESNVFTIDVSHWNQGDVFAGSGYRLYRVFRADGSHKTDVTIPDDPDLMAGNTTGCAVNWRTGEVWATNFDEYYPALNVITRHAGSNPLPYTDPSRRLSTERYGTGNSSTPIPGYSYPFDISPESVAFDNAGNMFVGHSFGFWNDAGDVADENGTTIILHNPNGDGWIYVDATGTPLVDIDGNYLYDNTPISPAGFFERWIQGNPPTNILGADGQPLRAPVQGGMDVHKYTPDANGNYNTLDRQFFDFHYGNTGIDTLDLMSDQQTMIYSSEDWYVYRYNVSDQGAQMAVVGSAVLGESRPFTTRATYGVRVLPPGDGTGGYLAVNEYHIERLDQNGRVVQVYDVHNDPDYEGDPSIGWAPNDVNGWFSISIAPGGRTFWAATRQDVYHFDLASGAVIGSKVHATRGTVDTPEELAGLCVMDEYRAAQEVCGPTGLGNNIDDDGDGTIDEGCFRVEVCSPLSPGDDDGDGLIDYNDPDCGAVPAQQCVSGGPTDNSVAGICDRADYEGDDVHVPGVPLPCEGPTCADWTFNYTAVNLPPGLIMDPLTGAVTGMPLYSVVNPNSETSPPEVFRVTVNATWRFKDQPPSTFSNEFNWTISNRNRVPVANDDGLQVVLPGASFAFDVRVNDSDIDGDTLSIESFTQPPTGQGTVAQVGQNLVYTAPASGFFGTTSFTYMVKDTYNPAGISNVATVRVKINALPVAVNDSYTTPKNTALNASVVGNDTSSADGGNVWTKTSEPSHGTVTMTAGGDFTYTPATGYTGTDSFTYNLCDVDNDCSTATVTIKINDAPLANDDAFTTAESTAVSGTLTGNDTTSADGGNVWTKTSNPANGTAVVNADGTFTYTPNAGFSGVDTFNYQICDADADCDPATVTITIEAKRLDVVASPVCIADTPYVNFTITPNFTPVVGANATLVWKDSTGAVVQTTVIPWTNVNQPLTGQVLWPGTVVDGNGVATDWPGWLLQGGVWIQGSDGFENTRPTSTVEISVNPTTSLSVSYPPATPNCNAAPPANKPPVAVNDAYTTAQDTPITVPVPGILVNDSDPENGPLVVVLPTITQPSHGTVTQNADGSLTYTPNAGFSGVDSYTYQVRDAAGLVSNVATVTITITPANDVPVAVNDAYTTQQNTPITASIAVNDTPSRDGGNVWTKTSNPGNGTVVVNANGTFTYTPNQYFFGTDTFTYKVCDANGDCSSATVTIQVVCPPGGGTPLALVRRSTMFDAGSRTEGNIQMLTGAQSTFNSNATLVGDLFVPGVPNITVNGTPAAYGGVVDGSGLSTPTGYTVMINSGASLGRIVRRTDAVAMPTVTAPPTPTGTRSVSLNNAGDPIGAFATLRDLTLNSNTMNVDVPAGNYGTFTANNNTSFTLGVAGGTTPTVYNFKALNMNGSSSLYVVGPVVVTVGQQIGFNAIAGNAAHPEWLTFNVASGGLNLNSSSTKFYGYTVVPNGALIVNSGSTLVGGLAADSLTVNSNARITLQALGGGCLVPDYSPEAVNDTFTTAEDTPITDSVVGNDTPSADGGNVWTKTSNPANGTATMNPDGTFTYTPNANFNGTDSFTYKVCDADGDCATATVTITITPADDEPVAVDDAFTTPEDTPVSGSLTGNDTLSGDGGNVWSKTSNPANGTATVNPDGTFTYTPNADFNGTDSFTYQVCDVDGDCATATVTITITPVNDVPLAVNDAFTTAEDTPVSGTLTANDTRSGDGGNVWTKTSNPSNGTATVDADGEFTYTPNANFTGTDSFTYKVCDANGDCSTATVTITITPVNDVPVAVNDAFTTAEDTPITSTVRTNDTPSGDGGNVWSKVTNPSNGTAVVNADGTFTYTPNANYFGTDSFTYKVCDADNDCSTATVTITITSANDVPVAVNDAFTTAEDTPVSGTLKNNDTLSGDGGNVWSKVTNPSNGTAVVNADGTFTYTPNANYYGTDAFTYKVCDVDGDCSTAVVTITITPVDEVPVAVNDNYTGVMNTPFVGSVPLNDTPSPDGGNVWSIVTGPTAAMGTVSFNPNGSFTFTPVSTFSGVATFTYKVCDIDGDCSTAVVTITIATVCEPGPFTTYTQGGWGAKPNGNNPAKFLANNFATVYPGGFVQIGGTKYLKFTSAQAIEKFLPAGGTASQLTSSATNPTSSSAGVLAGQVLAAQLNVDFSRKGLTKRGLENQIIVGTTYTVGYALEVANAVLGGAALPSGITISDINSAMDAINQNYDNGTQNLGYLADPPSCGTPPPPPPTNGEVCYVGTNRPQISARQQFWGNTDGTITIRTWLSRNFNDNTYGTNAIGWPNNKHTFSDLVGSDKAQIALYDAAGTKRMEFAVDYITASSAAPSGYKSLGVTGGDGSMISGSASDVVSATSSLAENFNAFGYKLTTNSPSTNSSYATNASYPNWIWDVWYEVTVKSSPFSANGFGYPRLASVHASPSKTGTNTEPLTLVACAGPNAVPVAVNDSYTTAEDVAVSGSLKTNDTASTDGGNTWAKTSNPSNGTATVNADGTFSYTPNANFTGTDSFTYEVCDTDGDCDEATATIDITSVNDLPVAANDTFTTPKNTAVSGSLKNNDTLSGDGGNVWARVTNSANGTATVNSDGTFTFTPASGFSGTTTFTYKLCDTDNDCSTATVTIRINDVPVAVNDTFTTPKNTMLSGALTGNDTSSSDGGNVWTRVTNSANGNATVNSNGTFTFTPTTGFTGTTTFTYKVCDVDNDCSTATVTIRVNDAPVAVNDSFTTAKNTAVSGSLTGNDTASADGGNVWTRVTNSANGTATVNANGTFTFTPTSGFTGTTTFTYKVCDADNDCSTATVTIKINDVPVAVDDSFTTPQNTAISGSLNGNDTPSADGGNVWTRVTNSANGTATVNVNGTFTFTPTSGFSGTTTFTYKVCDADNDCSTATVTITVAPVVTCSAGVFDFTGNTAAYGTAGNIRTYSISGVSVKASAFSRTKSGGSWSTAYLGAFQGGLGVTDGSEGNGSGDSHTNDNVGDRTNYILFEFSQPVTISRAYLGYVVDDSDMTVWYGTKSNPYSNHQTLSDSLLSSLTTETNSGGSSTRWASLGSDSVTINTLVIAAKTTESNDEFKVEKLDMTCDTTGGGSTPPAALVSGDTATIGFWQNSNGQALIKKMNGSSYSKNLGNWLASNYPYLFGAYAGSSHNMTNKTNTEVAAYDTYLFGSDKWKNQVLGGAIAIYVTNSTLAGGNYSVSYGFNYTATGTGAKTYNVGSYGSAIGLSNNTSYTIAQLLAQANLRKQQGNYDSNAFNVIFSGINESGDI